MPAEPRISDNFTRDALLLGFSQVQFTPTGGTAIDIGILASEELQKTVETLRLEDGSSGLLTVNREIISRMEPSFVLGLYNFEADIAQYLFGAESLTENSAATVAVAADGIVAASASGNYPATDIWTSLSNRRIDETVAVTATGGTVTNEAVGTGDGTLGAVSGEYALDFKIDTVADVASVTVGGVSYAPVNAATSTALEAVIVEGTGATSGDIQFVNASGTPIDVTGAILATYTPALTLTENTDYIIDPVDGRVRFLALDTIASRQATIPVRSTQPIDFAYSYSSFASNSLQPFTKNQVDGSATIKHLPDVGSNFIWQIPSVTILQTDAGLTFGADDFVTGELKMNVNDAGGTDRFGTLELFDETQADI